MDVPTSTPSAAASGETKLDAGAHLWKSLFEASQDAQVICAQSGAVQHLNPRAVRLLKITDPPRLNLFQIIPEAAERQIRQSFRRTHPQPEILYSILISAGGESCGPLDLEITPLPGQRLHIVFKDASRRLRLESHVRRLVTAIDSTPEVFFITDAECRIAFVNPAFQIHTGYSIEDVLGRNDAFLRTVEERSKVASYQEAVRAGHEWMGILTNVRHDGSRYQVEATISPIFDMAGGFMGYVGCERDITERIRLENELRLESDFIHSILTSLDSAIYTVDREFRLTHANDGWQRMPEEHGGIRPGGAPELGRFLLDYVPTPERRADLQRLFQEVLSTGQAQENQYASPDERRWVLKISPLIHNREVRGLICSVSDQTHFHQLQSQLFQSQKMEIIGTLAAGVAHDFNNLLQAIRGNVSLLLLQLHDSPPLLHCAEQISVAASRAAEITQQLLTFSRNAEEKDAVIDLNQVIQEAGHLARRTIRGNINLELIPSAEPIPVKIDATRANQALLNLCVNAQDAMPEGGRLTISSTLVALSHAQRLKHEVSLTAEFACCDVSDTGSGIPAEIVGRIFEPFFTTKEKGKGTGLGLPIVQRVLIEAGGFVEVDSAVGHGTTFHLYFPVAREAMSGPAVAPLQQLAQGSGRVLVVDDLDLLRDFTRSFLEAAGFSVMVASSGADALKVLEQAPDPIDLLFTDYSMPGMNGIELIEEVKVKYPGMKLVLASGYLDDTARARLDDMGVNVLCKPYDMRDGAELIIRLLSSDKR